MPDSEWTVDSDDDGTRLDKFLAHPARLGSRARAAAAIDRGKVYVNDAVTDHAALRLSAGNAVRVWMDKPGTARRTVRAGKRGELDIVYEDDALVVVNKPAGFPRTVPRGSTPSRSCAHSKSWRYFRRTRALPDPPVRIPLRAQISRWLRLRGRHDFRKRRGRRSDFHNEATDDKKDHVFFVLFVGSVASL